MKMEKISWSPKIRQSKIRQLYQNDALGAVDEILVEDVGLGLLERCRSIWLVTQRQVECPRCGATFSLCEPGSWKMLPGVQRCPTSGCEWETTAEQWHESWKHRELLGTAAMDAIETYLHEYPRARTTQQQMICIDQLIHSFHMSLRTGKASRSFANNLIEGSHDQVIEFLDRLSARAGGVDKERWRAEVNGMYKRRRGQE
ncbi:MAG TPA: hypothetical protein VGK56_01625 [Anaerolineales bacterium]